MKCSNCEKEINELISVETGVQKFYSFDGVDYDEVDEQLGELEEFRCPYCNKFICKTEEEAKELLKEVE